jgi:hypothetical protein
LRRSGIENGGLGVNRVKSCGDMSKGFGAEKELRFREVERREKRV